MEVVDYDHLNVLLKSHQLWDWGHDLESITRQFLQNNRHGKIPVLSKTLSRLPRIKIDRLDLNHRAVTVTTSQTFDIDWVTKQLMSLLPWRKGPFHIHGIDLDTEWRSDLKWGRIVPHLSSLKERCVLDVGCGNGYHMWRMLGAGARCVVGVDPMQLFAMQFLAIRHFVGEGLPVLQVPIGIENLPRDKPAFDTIFSMGVLYHRRDPVIHIRQLCALLKPGGELILETLIIKDDTAAVLIPKDRYACMRNVWNIASLPQLIQWMEQVNLKDIQVVDVSATTSEEQRTTQWMPYHSLKHSLDPDNSAKTVEGYPAPVRAVIIAKT